jgi:modified peptide precursor CbpA
MKNTPTSPRKAKPRVIATRKACRAQGTGLSHYILMDKKGQL